jgi:2-keto-4-pentenoate hydratase/2-oxohepta-3-ene-1,7-dioic acid hydratase in catechol pathway
MRIVRFSAGKETNYGVLIDGTIRTLGDDPFSSFGNNSGYKFCGTSFLLEKVKLLAPCTPSKIVCLGVNYRTHAKEMSSTPPPNPLIFIKPSTAVIGPEEPIMLPFAYKRVDYEGELAVVIGRKARLVSARDSSKYVLGYTCFNDVTERQFQKDDVQWTRAKGFDTFAPVGPWIETEIEANDLQLETYLNGELRQKARTSELIFGIPAVISFISGIMTLLPGDIIATGTPAGIAPMNSGDIIEVKIEKIGTLRNNVIPFSLMS